MVLVDSTPVNTVYAEQFELVFAVERNEVVMNEAFLWHFVFVRYLV